MQIWNELVSTAIVGTGKNEFRIDLSQSGRTTSEAALASALTAVGLADREGAVLHTAGILGLWRQAGWRPLIDAQPGIEPAPAGDLPVINAAGSRCLARILSGQHRELLPECLKAIAATGQRVREEHLPALLDAGINVALSDMRLREYIAAASGSRGAWLAHQNDRWAYMVPVQDEILWETGARDLRLALLSRLRRSEPGKARELLSNSWSTEPAKDRAGFLGLVLSGLSEPDESFLESALADRSAEVRRKATDLLVRLRGSRLSREVGEVITPMLSFKKKLLGKSRIEVDFQEQRIQKLQGRFEFDAEQAGGGKKLGEKGAKLSQLIAATPASHWAALFNISEDDLLKAAIESEWKDAIVGGLSASLAKHSDARMIGAFTREWMSGRLGDGSFESVIDPVPALRTLPESAVERLVIEVMKSDAQPLDDRHAALALLKGHRRSWSPELARFVIGSVKKRTSIDKEGKVSVRLVHHLKGFGLYIPPTFYDEAERDWPTGAAAWPYCEKIVGEFLTLLKFRREMHLAIANAPRNQ